MHKLVVALALLGACKGKESSDPAPAPTADKPVEVGCAFLSGAKVKELTGVAVTATKPANPQGCAMFKTADGKDFLYVASAGPSSYAAFVDSNPKDMFPIRTPLTGVGAEAILLRVGEAPEATRTVVARSDARSVQLTPQLHAAITDDQLTALARASM